MTILARLRGTIEAKTAEAVLMFVGGLGFEVQVPRSTMANLPEVGEEATLWTHLYVREGSLGLYGFASEGELRMFELLLSVTGIGPKAALNCLSLLSVDQLAGAIAAGDGEILRRVPGVGRRTADRMLLELKGRVQDLAQTPAGRHNESDNLVLEALMFYGHSATEAAAAIAALPKDQELTVEERLLRALQYFAPNTERQGRN